MSAGVCWSWACCTLPWAGWPICWKARCRRCMCKSGDNFYVTTFSALFLVLAFPGFIARFFWKRRA
ncbi:MAG: DUF2818 family protein [Rivihabitans pingtungensis]